MMGERSAPSQSPKSTPSQFQKEKRGSAKSDVSKVSDIEKITNLVSLCYGLAFIVNQK